MHLKLFGGRAVWHQRYYRPEVRVVQGSRHTWFEENGRKFKVLNLQALGGLFEGRANLLLSGPSVKAIEQPERLAAADLIGVNGTFPASEAAI